MNDEWCKMTTDGIILTRTTMKARTDLRRVKRDLPAAALEHGPSTGVLRMRFVAHNMRKRLVAHVATDTKKHGGTASLETIIAWVEQ